MVEELPTGVEETSVLLLSVKQQPLLFINPATLVSIYAV